MKKFSFAILGAVAVMFFASYQSGDSKDANGNTPSMVVEKMYQSLKSKDYAEAVSYNKIPDTVKIEKKNTIYEEFKDVEPDKDNKVVVTSADWKDFLIGKMESLGEDYVLESWEIFPEEVSKTDINSAKVKTRIHFTDKNGQHDSECSFSLRRSDNVWLIIG